jgi:hypothetical protein
MKRRQFLQSTALFSVATLFNANELFAKTPLINTVGLGLFSLPKMLDNDFEGAFAMLDLMNSVLKKQKLPGTLLPLDLDSKGVASLTKQLLSFLMPQNQMKSAFLLCILILTHFQIIWVPWRKPLI